MPDQQNFDNHARWDPAFHFFLAPALILALILTTIHAVKHPDLYSAWMIVIVLAILASIAKARLYALKVQDRVIRLEERLRLGNLLDASTRPRIAEFTERQLIALRFASDAELPGLAAKTLTEKLTPQQIKQSIQTWRPDHWRV